MNLAVIENIATLLAIVVLTVTLWGLGAGGWSFWSLILLMNMNYLKK